MSGYFSFGKKTITDFSEETIDKMYDNGYVFTRLGKGIMNQTRSLRIDLSKFELTSENRRVWRKTNEVKAEGWSLPFAPENYDWSIQKLAKDFYTSKFGAGTFSANKVKTLLTDKEQSNFNFILSYQNDGEEGYFGYAICYKNCSLLHYAFPFYDFLKYSNNYGMSMMINAIIWAKCSEKEYVYLGGITRPADIYKLQFQGLEWFDGKQWQIDLDEAKKLIGELKVTPITEE